MRKKIGIFGGSFDPVHNGHRELVLGVLAHFQLAKLLIIPTSQNPLKDNAVAASADDRLSMLQLCFKDLPDVTIDPREIRRAGPGYTVETLRHLVTEYPQAELLLFLGSDNLASLDQWRDIESLFDLCTPVVITRAGTAQTVPFEIADSLGEEVYRTLMRHLCSLSLPKVSSSEIRQRLRENKDISQLVPPAVASFIAEKGLYQLCST